jgi:Flp pilus assembly pilin Flp
VAAGVSRRHSVFQMESAMRYVIAGIGRLVRRDDGQDLLEYGLLVVLIAILAMGAISTLGQTVLTVFWNDIASQSF